MSGSGDNRQPSDAEFRERWLQAVMAQRGCDREEGEVIMRRIADRLGGYTHDEVAEMHPLPGERP